MLSKDELIVLARCVVCSLLAMGAKKSYPAISDIEKKVTAILARHDMTNMSHITLLEFQSLIHKDIDVLRLLRGYKLLLSDDLRESVDMDRDTMMGDKGTKDQEIECDSDIEVEIDKEILAKNKSAASNNGVEKVVLSSFTTAFSNQGAMASEEELRKANLELKNRAFTSGPNEKNSYTPNAFKTVQPSYQPPNVNIELAHVYGFRGSDCRNNVRMAPNGDVVSFIGKVCWMMQKKTFQQRIFQAHTSPINCMTSVENYIATGDIAPEPTIYIWDYKTSQIKLSLRGLLKDGIAFLCFSNDGRKLAAVDMSENRTVVIYDFYKLIQNKAPELKDQVIAIFKGPSRPVFDIVFDSSDSNLVFGCKKSIAIADLREEKVELKEKSSWGAYSTSLLCLGVQGQFVVAGAYSGQIMIFKGADIHEAKEAHKSPCSAIWSKKSVNGFITGGYDGMVHVWDSQFTKAKSFMLSQDKPDLISFKIKAVCEDTISGNVIVGLKSGEIIEISSNGGPAAVICKGQLGSLTGLDKVGVKEEAVSVGCDKELHIWELSRFKDKKSVRMEFEAAQVASSPDGTNVAVGFINGYVQIFEMNNNTVVKKLKDRSQKITLIKYFKSTEFTVLAVGAMDNEIIFYKVQENYKLLSRIKGLKGFPLSIDFSIDGKVVQICDQFYGLKYYESYVDATKIKPKLDEPGMLVDLNWATWTSPVGWPVHKLFNNIPIKSDVTALALSPDQKVIAVGMVNGDMRFYRYPVISNTPFYTQYSVHSSPIARIIFTDNGKHIVSIGREDRAVVQWKFENSGEGSRNEEGAQVTHNLLSQKSKEPILRDDVKYEDKEFFESLKVYDDSIHPKQLQNRPNIETRDDIKFPIRQDQAPDQNLELRHIFGCKFEGMPSCAKFASGNTIVYFSANKAIVRDSGKETGTKPQSFFTKHTSEIISIDIHKNKELVATGERAYVGQPAKIYLWHVETKMIVASMTTVGTGGVIKLKFSQEGNRLISVSNDDTHTIDVFDIPSGKHLTSVPSESKPILDMCFKNENEFASVTYTGVRFWEFRGRNLVSTPGKWATFPGTDKDDKSSLKSAEPLTCCIYAFMQNVCFTGTNEGSIYSWNNNEFQKVTSMGQGNKAIRVMVNFKNLLYTAGEDGKIISWNYSGRLQIFKEIEFKKPMLKEISIRSMDINSDGIFLVGSVQGTLFLTSDQMLEVVAESHFKKGILALTVNPSTNQFVTSGDDGRLILWDASTRKLLASHDLEIGELIVALDWAETGEFITGATNKGRVLLFDKTLNKRPTTSDTIFHKTDNKICAIKIAPKVGRVAIASNTEQSIQIEDINDNRTQITHSGTIETGGFPRFLDWSSDGEFLAVTFENFDIKYFTLEKHSFAPFSVVKDKNWATWTQPVGPFVKGLNLDLTAVQNNPVCRSQKTPAAAKDYDTEYDKKPVKLFIVTGNSSGEVGLYRYPSVIDNSDYRGYNAFCHRVNCIKIFYSDTFVVATSDQTNAIALFETDFKNDTKNLIDNVEAVLTAQKEEPSFDRNHEILPRPSLMLVKAHQQQKEEQNDGKRDIGRYYLTIDRSEEQHRFTKPWLGMLRYPTDYIKPPINSQKAPKIRLVPEHVFGVRTKDTRSTLKYISAVEVAYPVATFVVIHQIKTKMQRFFTGHQSDVVALCYKSAVDLVASAELGGYSGFSEGKPALSCPVVCIWSPVSLTVTKRIECTEFEGINKVQFGTDAGSLLILGTDKFHTIGIVNYNTGVFSHIVRGDTLKIMDLRWFGPTEFISVGFNHIKFWKIENNQLKSVRGKFDPKHGQQRLLCCAINKKDVLAGTANGFMLVWKRGSETAPTMYPILSSNDKSDSNCSIDCICITDLK